MDKGRQAGGEDDAAFLPPLPRQVGAPVAERVPRALPLSGISNLGQFYFGDLLPKWVNIQSALTTD
jgi:hypothetical protein